jgi:hypothetical protein
MQPRRGIAITFRLIRLSVDGQKFKWIIGERDSFVCGE